MRTECMLDLYRTNSFFLNKDHEGVILVDKPVYNKKKHLLMPSAEWIVFNKELGWFSARV